MEECQPLLQTLVQPTCTSTAPLPVASPCDHRTSHAKITAISSNASIAFRLVFIAFVGLVSIWANHEAFKGFAITAMNEPGQTSLAGRRFSLFYLSDDEATRIVLNASKFVERILYSDDDIHIKKKVNHIFLRLASQNLTGGAVVVTPGKNNHEFVIHISPSTLEEGNFNHGMLLAVHQGMSRVWLFDSDKKAANSLIDGIVEYIVSLAGLGTSSLLAGGGSKLSEFDDVCWKAKDPRAVAQFLDYCEEHQVGFIRRLNQGMNGVWDDRTVDSALGMPAQHMCSSFKYSASLNYSSIQLRRVV